jgi:protein-tyrosine phosphatase
MDQLYIGDLPASKNYTVQQDEEIMFVVDVRTHFNGDQTPRESALEFAWGITDLMNRGKVLIYCRGGIDRSPFIAALVMKLDSGISMTEAYEEIKMRHPQTFIHDDWGRRLGLKW